MWKLETREVKEDPGLALGRFVVTKQEKKNAASPKTASVGDLSEAESVEVWGRVSQLLAAVFCLLSPHTGTADFSL